MTESAARWALVCSNAESLIEAFPNGLRALPYKAFGRGESSIKSTKVAEMTL